jgi:hypothetical protein
MMKDDLPTLNRALDQGSGVSITSKSIFGGGQ